ncbi:MAG: hypothetical protein ACFFD2_13345 [Promethearchaeota archaeon]
MPIKSPNTDAVFEKWINKTPAKSLEKKFKIKDVPFQKSNISAAESVKTVEKFTAFYFESEKKGSKTPTTVEEEYTDLKTLGKIKFYEFTEQMDSEKWKDKTKVPLYDTLKPDNCKKCHGTGYINCKKCKGEKLITCKDCKGRATIKCKDCDGTGSKSINITVIKNGKEKSKKQFKYQCPTCFGTSKIECKKCGGTGKIPCPDCKANARYKCDKCKGYGHFYIYGIGYVPFKLTSAVIPHLYFKADVNKELEYRLSNAISQVEGIKIQDYKNLDEHNVQSQLGYELDSDAKKMMNTTKKEFEKIEKNDLEKPHYPILIFPVLELDIVTPKNKKFKLFSIGPDTGYIVLDQGFK